MNPDDQPLRYKGSLTEHDNASDAKHAVTGRRFGDTGSFLVTARWAKDPEPVARRPAGYGWSMGELGIEVLGVPLTATRVGDRGQRFVGWCQVAQRTDRER